MKTQKFSLSWLRQICPQIEWHNFQECQFEQVYNDSRQVTPNSLFFALSGVKEEGEKYISEALSRGACACILEKKPTQSYSSCYGVSASARKILAEVSHALYGYPTQKMCLIGITGTNGKTTTSFLLQKILEQAGYSTGLLGTTGYFYAGQSYSASHTTPDSLVLNKHFYQMYERGISHVVMEVSSHSLALNRVAHVNYNHAIFTNLSRDHLDYHKTMESYREAKSLLFRNLSSSSHAVLNADDPESSFFASVCSASIIWFSLQSNPTATVYAQNIREISTGTDFELVTPHGTQPVRILLPGQYNVSNAIASASCAWEMGVPLPIIALGLNAMKNVPGRMQRIPHLQDFQVFVDFAHTDQALERALSTLSRVKKNRLIVVFGCGGDRDAGKRPLMGKVAQQYADFTWITNDNPRSEVPQTIANSISKGFDNPKKYEICLDRYQAIEHAIHSAQPGDIILIAGKGHETGQIIGSQTFPFSDEQVALEILQHKKS